MTNFGANLNLDTARNIALGTMGGAFIIGIILMKVVSSIVGKAISAVLMLALVLGAWSQRASITTCANTVRTQVVAGNSKPAECTFFGQKVSIPLPSK